MQGSFSKHIYRILVVVALSTLLTGTIVYHFVEKFSWLNSYYFSVITLATVGYGDFTPHTNFGKIFTTFYVLIGIGIITTFINYTMRRQAQKFNDRHGDKNQDK
jgi:voltage-gated potassium channel